MSGARLSLEGPDHVGGDPAAVEAAGLRNDRFLSNLAAVHPSGVKSDVIDQGLEARARIRVVPRRARCDPPAHDVEVPGQTFPFAEGAAGGRSQSTLGEGGPRQVVGRRVRGFEHLPTLGGVADQLAAEAHLHAFGAASQGRRPRVAPDRFLPGSASESEWDGNALDQRTFAGMSLLEIQVHRAANRFVTSGSGLVSRHSFSFGEHYDPVNVSFGPLLVSNEDRIEVARGYDDHPHRDAEIVTWVLSGSLQHSDSYGNRGLVYPRLAQRMSAGAGIVHAERNDGYRLDPTRPAEPVHFVQMWLRPDEPGGPAGYAQAEVSEAALGADWVPVVSGSDPDRAVGIGTAGATLWVTTMEPGARRRLPEADLVHLFVARGAVEVESVGRLESGDALRLGHVAALNVEARSAGELLVWTFAARALDAERTLCR